MYEQNARNINVKITIESPQGGFNHRTRTVPTL